MKAVILAGGLGTRLAEETVMRPKPMIEIGGMPILWHIMKIYGHYGVQDFIICCGYKQNVVKDFFSHYSVYSSDITFDLKNNSMKTHLNSADDWRVTVVDTGENTQTGGRLKRVRKYLADDEPFHFTYGDAVANVDIGKLTHFHRSHGRLATVTAVQPMGRFGRLGVNGTDGPVETFDEKPDGDGSWINGGFFVLSPKVIDYIGGDADPWEGMPMRNLVADRQLEAFHHSGYWQCMDTQRDHIHLESLWQAGAPWKIW